MPANDVPDGRQAIGIDAYLDVIPCLVGLLPSMRTRRREQGAEGQDQRGRPS